MAQQTQPLLRTRNCYDDVKKYERFLCIGGLLTVIGVAIAAFVSYALWTLRPPSFKVESASVLFHKSNNSSEDAAIRAEWNIRLSVKAGTDYYKFDYNDLHVLFRRMPSDWSRTVLVQSSDDPKNMTSLNATVETLLPRSFYQESMLEFEVMFVVQFVDDPIMKAACNHMMVGVSPDAKEGIMKGGPRLCPYRRKRSREGQDCFPIV